MAQHALARALRKSNVTSCIIGASRPQQVEENAEASGVKLDESVIARMEEIVG
jgi:aryl-alcohol dehydrogenase-like predicted oxidoreductase